MDLIFNRKNVVDCLIAFALAIPMGGIFSFLAPQLANSYVLLIESRVFSTMGTPAGVPLGLKHVAVIFANNLIPVAVGFAFPPLIAAYNLGFAIRHPNKYSGAVKTRKSSKIRNRLSTELYFNLTAFGVALAFASGFFAFGIFPGYLLQSGGLSLLGRGLRDISLHSPFEIAATLMSASVALGLRDLLIRSDEVELRTAASLKRLLWRLVKSKRMAVSLTSVAILVGVGALVEVYLSAPVARNG